MNKNSKATLFLGLPYYLWAAFFIVIPLFMVVWYGLTDKTGAFTLANVLSIMRPAHMKALILSIVLSLGATVVCLLLAYPLCMFLVESQKKADSFLVMLLIVPMWMNFLLRTYAWQSILEKTGILNAFLNAIGLPSQHLINTPGGIILGMVYDFLPFMILPIYNALEKIDVNVVNAAHDLGANGTQTFTCRASSPASRWSSCRRSRPSSSPRSSAVARSSLSATSSSRSSRSPTTGIWVRDFRWCFSFSSS